MRHLLWYITLGLLLVPAAALASAPSLQVNPLKYVTTMTGPDVRDGYVDVANPSDATVNVQASVQGFKQYDLAGDLSFFDDKAIQSAIRLSLTSFQISPQQAVRVPFSVDPRLLPKGGIYAVIFFRTVAPAQSSTGSFVTESASVGTLLILQNGPTTEHIGRISRLMLPFWQFGSGVTGTAEFKNTDNSVAPVAFSPRLAVIIEPFGRADKLTGPFVLPGSTRSLVVSRPGSYFGLLPVSVVDTDCGMAVTAWVFACTGIYAFLFLYLIALLLVYVLSRLGRRLPLVPEGVTSMFGPREPQLTRPIDGLGTKRAP